MDWERMERRLRDSLKQYYEQKKTTGVDLETTISTLDIISEIIGEETGRGFPND